MKAKNIFFLSVGAVVLVVVLGIAGVFYFRLKNVSENNPMIVEEVVDSAQVAPTVETQTQPGPNDFPKNFEIQDLTSSLGGEKIVVDWYKGAKPATEEEYQKIVYAHDPWMKEINDKKENACLNPDQLSKDQPQNRLPCPVYLYRIGTIKSPEMFQGQTLYLLLSGWEEMGFGYSEFYTVFDAKTEKLVAFIQEDNPSTILTESFNELGRFISGYVKTPLVFLKYPQIIKPVKQDFLLRWYGSFSTGSFGRGNGSSLNFGGIFDAAKGGINSVYNEKDKVLSSEDGTPVYFIDNNFQIQLADGAVHLYSLIPYFLRADELLAEKEYYPSSFIADIVWTNGNDKKNKYVLGGDIELFCGMYIDILTNVVDKKDWFSEEKLVEAGKTKKGENIYELSDKKTNPYYKKLFDYGYEGSQVAEGSYEYDPEAAKRLKDDPEGEYSKFIADTPIFFWQDDFGNWRVYFKSKYRSLAECGKPVIYLYPEKEMDVKVRVAPNGGFTKTEPEYNGGWVVRATPESELFNYADKKNYPYLFWEGKAYGFSIDSTRGFVMAKADVGAEMARILGKLGLNGKETKDFMEFWQPKLEIKPYVFVTFVPQSEFNKAAPLAVNPRPDTIIRVFMDYTPLDAPINIAPLQIKTPERKGFVVVEWGGRLR